MDNELKPIDEAAIRATMTSEQIQLERKLTCEAIDGAIAFGYQDTNPPPSDDHWLAPFWKIGRQLGEAEEKASASPAHTESAAPMTRDDVERQYRDGIHIASGLPRATCQCGFCAKHRFGFNSGDGVVSPAPSLVSGAHERAAFQSRVQPWMLACFGAAIAADTKERNHRFFEESGELVQARGMTREEAHALVDYTWSRPKGEPFQEVGGVMVTLAALCLANGLDMHAAGEAELARITEPATMDRIRAKQATKPKHSPLPEHVTPVVDCGVALEEREAAPSMLNIDDGLKALDGPLLELDALLANLHQDVWESASQSLCAYDEAGLEEAKAIQRHVRAMLSADRTAAPEPHHLTGEQIAALRVAADTLIERYAAPIRAILANADQFDAAKALAASGAWQPIETAPRDGTPVLGCVFHEKLLHLYAPTTIYWAAYHPNAEGEKTWRTSLIGGHKMRGVTHWMPIPTVPTEGSDA